MDQQTVIYALAVSFGAVFTALISVLTWLAIRMTDKVDKIPGAIEQLEKIVVGEIHRLDLRIARLEAWRDGIRPRHPADSDDHQ